MADAAAPAQHGLVPHSHGGSAPEASRAQRRTSFDPADFAVPAGNEEEWRFTPVRAFAGLLAENAGEARVDWTTVLPSSVTATTISLDEARSAGILPPGDRAAAIAVAYADGAVRIDIPADAELDEPIRVNLVGTGAEPAYGHLVIRAGRHSRATVIVEHAGVATFGEVVSTVIGDGAQLTVVSLQDWDDASVHAGQHDALVGRDSTYKYVCVTLGGKAVRLNANVRYAGPGGSAEILGVYFADSGQHLEHRSFVDHNSPRCTSNVVYKGALQGETAHTVWVGDVLIQAVAEGTDTYELNRNLVLTDGARADSVPNLEIETGQIEGAGHASATGRFDDEQLFYLQARGIPADIARRLVVRGFFADIIRQIGVDEVEERLMAAIDDELAVSMGPLGEVSADEQATLAVVDSETDPVNP
ncbi:MAG: Fe-S cluster assembly protein SufD [Actinomycetales bacterium]